MNIVIPLLGRGSKFIQAGFTMPKPLIEVQGKYMLEWALDAIASVDGVREAIFILLRDHVENNQLDSQIKKILGEGVRVKVVDMIPDGAAKTVLLVRDEINTETPLIIYNSDQYFIGDIRQMISDHPEADGIIPYFNATHPKWSYILTDDQDVVSHIAEKEIISNKATVGLYYFKKGSDFVNAADTMIEKKIMIANEYYVAPTYNELIEDGKVIVGCPVEEMWGLGTPEDVEKFQRYHKD